MTTNGNRPPRPEESYLSPSTYSPRRRRNDAVVTGIIGFVVGAISGLGVLAVISLIAWLAAFVIGFVGWVPFMLVVMLAGGILLAITAVRSST
jgi:hypothetical protein